MVYSERTEYVDWHAQPREVRGQSTPKLEEAPVGGIVTVGAMPSFNDLLLEAIDEAFSSLGESVRVAIYFHLKNTFGIKKSDIPSRIACFSSALEKIFGAGARHLEILFMKNLHAKLEVTCKWPAYKHPLCKWIIPEVTFQEYIRLMRQNFEAKNENKTETEVLLNEQEELQH
jgi:hypothetical protein